MADTKISGMTNAAPLTGAELVPLVQSGVNVKATAQDIANLGVGGSFTAGNGIDPTALAASTIGNTGTIIQQDTTIGNFGVNISIVAGAIVGPGTAALQGGENQQYAGNVTVTDIAGVGNAGEFAAYAGAAYSTAGTARGRGALFNMGGGYIAGNKGRGGGAYINAGFGTDQGGNLLLNAGEVAAGGTAGYLAMYTAGGFIVRTVVTGDPHNLNEWYQDGITHGVTVSQG